jgi:hypothetical protein
MSTPHDAIVTRPAGGTDGAARYLRLDADGRASWIGDPADATAFVSMREAARAAFRLPASERAYGLPRSVELKLSH